MKSKNAIRYLLQQINTSLRIVLITLFLCCIVYPLIVLVLAHIVTPGTADGSLLYNDEGAVLGSELIAQAFSSPDYFWSRPSGVNFDASASGGSNLSPASQELKTKVQNILAAYNGVEGNLIPADLITSSGSGLDPHISIKAARYQAQRVAESRHIPLQQVLELIETSKETSVPVFVLEPLVNVLKINIALDRIGK